MNGQEQPPATSTPEAENKKIEHDFELALRAAQNLRFGGGVRRSEEGNLYTEMADVFVHEGLSELDSAGINVESNAPGFKLFELMKKTPEAEAKRLECVAKMDLYASVVNKGWDERKPIIYQSPLFKSWLLQKGIELGEGDNNSKMHLYAKDFIVYEVAEELRNISPWLEDDEDYELACASVLPVLRNPELYTQAISKYDEWAQQKFSLESLPSHEEFDLFKSCRIDPESYLAVKMIEEEVAIKEKIKADPLVSKALSCLEVVDGKLKIQEGKDDTVQQLRQFYGSDTSAERVSLLILGANALFPQVRSRTEAPGQRYAHSRAEECAKLVFGQPIFFKSFDHDGDGYRTVFDPANIYSLQRGSWGTYPKEKYHFNEEAVYGVFGQEGGEEAIKNLKNLQEIGVAQALEEQLAHDTKRCFADAGTGERVATQNPDLFEDFKKRIKSSQNLNSPGDTVLHHRYYTNATTDESCTCIAFRKTQGSSDSSPYSSNPYESRQTLVVLKEGKEQEFRADNVSSFEVVNHGEQTRLVKHLNDGSTVEEIVS